MHIEWAARKFTFSLTYDKDDPPGAILEQADCWATHNKLENSGLLVLYLSLAYSVTSWDNDDVQLEVC